MSLFHKVIDSMAEDVLSEWRGYDTLDEADLQELVWEFVDGSEWVIYPHKAWELVDAMDSYEIADAYEEVRSLGGVYEDFWDLLRNMAYFGLSYRVLSRCEEILEEEEGDADE